MSEEPAAIAGVFESNGKGGGFLRSPEANYRIRPMDPIVTRELCGKAGLRGGEAIVGTGGSSRSGRNRRAPVLQEIESIDNHSVEDRLEATPFEDLIPIDPHRQLRFETAGGPTSMRVVDLLTPIGLGQRGLLVASPRTGKTILLQQMAGGVAANFPDVYLMVLLVDERPEEVTEMRRMVHGEVIASSNDEDIASHVRIARLMTQRAKRLTETGQDVVILLDSLTRLGRAFNAFTRGSGRIMSGGLDIRALIEPKSIFGAARKIENGGSLTVLASALIDTGSRMDEVIFNEFKGTGNMEIMLSREMANRRLWPAIDLEQSGTRKEDLLLSPEALEVSYQIRRRLAGRGVIRSMEALLQAMGKYPSNAEFVTHFNEQRL